MFGKQLQKPRRNKERGATLFYVAASLFVMLGMGAPSTVRAIGGRAEARVSSGMATCGDSGSASIRVAARVL